MSSKNNINNKHLVRIATSLEAMNVRLEKKDKVFSFLFGATIMFTLIFSYLAVILHL